MSQFPQVCSFLYYNSGIYDTVASVLRNEECRRLSIIKTPVLIIESLVYSHSWAKTPFCIIMHFLFFNSRTLFCCQYFSTFSSMSIMTIAEYRPGLFQSQAFFFFGYAHTLAPLVVAYAPEGSSRGLSTEFRCDAISSATWFVLRDHLAPVLTVKNAATVYVVVFEF